MPDLSTLENDFLTEITAVVEKNISNEQFGVTELADEMNMSRSNLLRKVKKVTNLSVSQLISQVRLTRGMEMLQKSELNVSEVSHRVGFSSTSYFIKCFREFYGYPPGEVGKRDERQPEPLPIVNSKGKPNIFILWSVGFVIVFAISLLLYYYSSSSPESPRVEKSIAVLSFKNESNDSSNVYLINGLMESTLINLQKIKDLKVISRTSSEKYRSTSKSIPEMAKELNANYFVEGSGQKIGDGILLNIQLIEGSSDRHLWAKQYRRQVKDIFSLQQEIAKDIAEEIQAVITPEEKKNIEKNPTDNLEAYDLFLKGRDRFYKGSSEDLKASIPYFKKAIEKDNGFALAYAEAAMVYYYLDVYQQEKKYAVEINSYADKALLLDSKLAESLLAKGLFYMHKREYERAVPYFEKALEYNPNSGIVLHFLSELYNIHTPNTTKYLQYSLQKVRLGMASEDSSTTSFNYLQLSNALLQTGFLDEAMKYIDKSLAYNPKNPFGYLKIFVRYAKTRDLKETKELLLKELSKDTTRFDIILQVGTIYYVMRDYENAYKYYKKFVEIREAKQLDVFKNENLAIGIVLLKVGQKEKGEEFIKSYKEYADNDKSIYKHSSLATYYAYRNDTAKALEHLALFSKEDNYQFWILLYERQPEIDSIRDLPEFKKIMKDIETKFWKRHDEIKETLQEKGLL